jgi:hypothetical protein
LMLDSSPIRNEHRRISIYYIGRAPKKLDGFIGGGNAVCVQGFVQHAARKAPVSNPFRRPSSSTRAARSGFSSFKK